MGNETVCTFGTSITKEQIKELSRFKKISFLFDPEREAQKKAVFYL